jgi:hypothetical protein
MTPRSRLQRIIDYHTKQILLALSRNRPQAQPVQTVPLRIVWTGRGKEHND